MRVQSFGTEQFIHALANNGYEHKASEFLDSTRQAYLGVNADKHHVFALAFKNEEAEDENGQPPYYVTKLFIEVRDGKAYAEWSGRPSIDNMTIEAVDAYFEGIRDAQAYIK